MPQIDETYCDSIAPNAAACKNGRATALKKIVALRRNEGGDLIFGEIKGSGAENYQGSADFADPAKPVFRCSCPSHQIPCKHVLGLLYALASGKTATVADIPKELEEKRAKAAVRKEAKAKSEGEAKPKTVNKAALAKKLAVQAEGLDKLERLLHDLVGAGFGSIGAKTLDTIDQLSRQLADAYLPGARNGLRTLRSYFYDEDHRGLRSAAEQDRAYSDALDQVVRLQHLCTKGRAYLEARGQDPDLKPETETSIAEQLGHAWQLSELRDAGCTAADIELLQLAFTSYDDHARQAFVDEGLWIELGSGSLRRTMTYRPYQAAKHIRVDDSTAKVVQVPELCIYPGDLVPRVRWDAATDRAVTAADRKRLLSHASGDLAAVLKTVKDQLRQPLAEKEPLAFLRFRSIGRVGDDLTLDVGADATLHLADCAEHDTPSCELFDVLPPALLRDGALLLRFHLDLDAKRLSAHPLTLVTADAVVRLTL